MKVSADVVAGDVPVLRVVGDVDLESADTLRSRLRTMIEVGSPVVVVDLTDVSFFDSTGLKVLDDIQRDAHQNDVALAVACPDERLLRLFRITGLLDRFSIEPTVEQAAASAGHD